MCEKSIQCCFQDFLLDRGIDHFLLISPDRCRKEGSKNIVPEPMTRIHDNPSPQNERLICGKDWSSVELLWSWTRDLEPMKSVVIHVSYTFVHFFICLSYYCSKKKLKWSNEKMREEREKLLEEIKINNAEIKRIQSEIKWVGFT